MLERSVGEAKLQLDGLRKILRSTRLNKEDEPEIPDITVRTSQSEKGEVEEGDREDGEEYLVESIVGHYLSEAGLWFLVKWSAYDDLTWEPEENLNCGHLVQQYFRRFK